MVSFTFATMTAVFAALTTALPAAHQKRESEYSLVLRAGSIPDPGLPLVAAHVSAGEFAITTGSGTILDGTPLKFDDGNIIFQINNLPYGMTSDDVGDDYGAHDPIFAVPGNGTGGFQVSGGYLQPKRSSGTASWMACNNTITPGQEVRTLEIGVPFTNGSAPWGCETAGVQFYTRG